MLPDVDPMIEFDLMPWVYHMGLIDSYNNGRRVRSHCQFGGFGNGYGNGYDFFFSDERRGIRYDLGEGSYD